jgi:hypothetical protein
VAISSSLALALGDVEGAIDLMELVVEKRAFSIPWLRGLFRHNELLQDHPRYLALLERIGLDDASVAAIQAELGLD